MTKSNKFWTIKLIVLTCIAAIIIFIFMLFYLWYENESQFDNKPIFENLLSWTQAKDFKALREKYPHIVAWIEVPNTNINLPVVQHPKNDYYYLTHEATGEQNVFGAIYMELCNKSDFSDPVTLLYGHNMMDDSMFATLHYFEDWDFFHNNQYFYIDTPGHRYTYTIVSAYAYDNRHIINTNKGFQNKEILKQYYDVVQNPTTHLKNVRDGIKLTENDKIVQLSTCMSDFNLSNQRYIVTGVLTDDQETN